MPRKCCTVHDGKACRSNYDETKNIPHEKVTTYSFPEDPTERELWIRSLPNILSCKITKNVSVCEKHFPPDCQRIKKPGGYLVPAVPPSIFGDTKCSLFVQTATPSRVPERNITAESRALKAAFLEKELDTINSFDMPSSYCSKFSPEHVVDVSETNVIKILKLKDLPPEVEYSIRIKDDFQVEAHRKHMKISTRDLINGFTNTLCRYSQIDNIVNRLKITPINLRSELAYLGEKVFELVNEIDSDKYLSSANNYCYLIVIATRLKIWLKQLIYICEVETVTELCGSF